MGSYGGWNATHRLAGAELRYVGELLGTRVGAGGGRRARQRLAERVRVTARRFHDRPRSAPARTAAPPTLGREVTTARS